jgi:hypothetical protein
LRVVNIALIIAVTSHNSIFSEEQILDSVLFRVSLRKNQPHTARREVLAACSENNITHIIYLKERNVEFLHVKPMVAQIVIAVGTV